ncbi:MAG TPA: CRTAC1 family protein, partial [Gemmatimonadales bacterium]|nr:CRTAC1 family protein [Gemmatimonadales bacterium]
PSPIRFPPAAGDLTTLLGWPSASGKHEILAGVAAYEAATASEARAMPSVVAYTPATGAMRPLVGGDTASVGPLAAADYDGDGNLDLFVGARIFPAGYPLSPSSRLYHNLGGRLTLDSANSALFARLGMVSAALFTDIDGDGDPDLLLAVEWGGIRVFRNDGGRFTPVQIPGLSEWYGRWNGLATGDLDGDGRLDIVATSWGRNTDYRVSPDNPLLLYVGFFAGGGRPDFLLAQQDPRIHAVAPLISYDRLSSALPAIATRLGSYNAYADASIDEVLGNFATSATKLGATTLDHMVFLNRGDHFEAHPLPDEAQWAPAFAASIADFNGDGHEDVLLSQNFFATDISTPRYDAGRGLLLLGDGKGGLEPVSGQQSGIMVYGEQRGAAYADFDGDGRLDLVIAENAAPTRLFHNVGATPGLRVRIAGPPGNPNGIGTQMRLRYGERAGPVREIQSGSGYWSQNGAVQVLGGREGATALWVRWPGGREEVVPLTPAQRGVTVKP